MPLRVRFLDLPLSWWTADSLSGPASALGKRLCADETTSSQDRIAYARVLINIDITLPYKNHLVMEDEDGSSFTQCVQYEW